MTSITPLSLDQARFNMIEQQVRPWEVLDPAVLGLLDSVKREHFVPIAQKALAYVDMELPLGQGTDQVMLAPRVQAASAARKLSLLRVNIDASDELAARERVVGVPVLALFRAGKEVARHAGELDDAALAAWLDQATR